MKVKDAEKLVCPFISNCVATADNAGEYHTNCITTKCMAWVETKEYRYEEVDFNASDLEERGFSWHDGETWRKEINIDNREGYCIRLKNSI